MIYVKDVFPCKGESANYQCEMSVESEIEAREVFSSKNLDVVGWYHSHPTFKPNPSIRDIENQYQYQKLFRNDNGIEPFIGIIVTPFYNHSNKSKINVFTVGKDFDTSLSYRNYYNQIF
ncbi:hypothetical protein PIROE2DRAFT_18882 [Piromyces sp. E2]|nr:hypothetical protein PIROE2DRAFT_18882 [Piromyces sp. E2]|eukprot:OUM56497.1 hypothetical protein PIROE2DRAFT_18882 [Piromyces sp. E2]